MALPSSGAISISQIRTELGTSDGSLRNLSSTAGKSIPDAMSEFYGYSNTPAIGLSQEYETASETCNASGGYSYNLITHAGTLGIGTTVSGVSVSGNNGFFLIVTGGYSGYTIGINDDNVVVFLEYYCPF